MLMFILHSVCINKMFFNKLQKEKQCKRFFFFFFLNDEHKVSPIIQYEFISQHQSKFLFKPYTVHKSILNKKGFALLLQFYKVYFFD